MTPRLDVTHLPADALATVECPKDCPRSHRWFEDASECPDCQGSRLILGRVPASLPLRVVVDEPLMVECICTVALPFPGCTWCNDTPGRVPLTEDVTVALVVEQWRELRYSIFLSPGEDPWSDWHHGLSPKSWQREHTWAERLERRTVVVGKAHGGRALFITDDPDSEDYPFLLVDEDYAELTRWWATDTERRPNGGMPADCEDVSSWLADGQDYRPGRWVYVFPTWTPTEPDR